MPKLRRIWAAMTLAYLMSAGLAGAPPAQAQAQSFRRIAVIDIPGEPLAAFDLSFVDSATQTYYLADRSNKGIDMIDARTNRFIGRIGGFVGPSTKNNSAGPNGIVVLARPHQLWAGDGDSTVKIVDLAARPPRILASVATGGTKRADEMAYDAKDGIVLVANDAEEPPFITLISTKADHKILGRIKIPDATEGIEQSVWDPAGGRFYISIPVLKDKKEDGGIIVIDPKTRAMTGLYPVEKCMPAGLALGPRRQLLVGCGQDAIDAGFPPQTMVLDDRNGAALETITAIGGSDQVWFNPGDSRYYLAARGMPGGPVLGVVDAKANKWLANLPTAKNGHSVAANPGNNHVFVPLTPNPDCPKGCIAVYGMTKG
ncbi:MAG: cytochrome C nitrite reductase [Alphaproteobacteria bacterium]|nr:cytochrome C nitrite reductase [Alphaproteobacteria bacterium]